MNRETEVKVSVQPLLNSVGEQRTISNESLFYDIKESEQIYSFALEINY